MNQDNILAVKQWLLGLQDSICDTLAAVDGEQGLRRLTEEVYDLVLMDVRMPRMDGLEATRRIRKMDGGSDTFIVGLTAGTMPEEIEACRDAGMDEVLTKPVTVDSFESGLSDWLKKQRA